MATVMTPEVVHTVLTALKSGLGIDTAARYAGVGERTIKDWLARGRAAMDAADLNDAPIPIEDMHYADFAREVDTSRAQAIARNITAVQTAASQGKPVVDRFGRVQYDQEGRVIRENGDWRAAAWWLEHVHPDQFGRSTRLEVTGADGGPIDVHNEHVVIGAIDHQVHLDVAADPARVAAIAQAMAHAGLLGHQAAIDVHAGETAPEDAGVIDTDG